MTPEAVLALDKEQLRGVGLSYAKVCAPSGLHGLQHAALHLRLYSTRLLCLPAAIRCLVQECVFLNYSVKPDCALFLVSCSQLR